MQTYDFIMLFVLGGLTIYGYSKGMAWQVAYLTSFIASYFVAAKFSEQLAPMFGDTAPWNKFVAMAVIYAGTSLAIWMMFRAVRGGIDKVKLQSFDHQMGAIVGAARGVLWCVGLTFFAVTLLPETQKRQIIGTRSGYYIAKLLDKSDAVVPPEVHEVIGPHLERLEQELNSGQGSNLGYPQPGSFSQGNGEQYGAGQLGMGQLPTGQSPWPQTGGQPAANNPWPQNAQAPQQSPWPTNNPPANHAPAWPTNQPSAGTPAQPAAWPQSSQPNSNWPR